MKADYITVNVEEEPEMKPLYKEKCMSYTGLESTNGVSF